MQKELIRLADEIVAAWERLPSGHYHPAVISNWLLNDMKPAIDKYRKLKKNVIERRHTANDVALPGRLLIANRRAGKSKIKQ